MAALQPGPDAIRFKVPESDRDSMTPEEYAVEFLDRDDKPYLGGCIVYGRYPCRERWVPNCSARWLVRHLIEANRIQRESLESASEHISLLQSEAIFDGQIVDAARKLRHEFTQDNLRELYRAVENLKEFQEGSGS